MEGASLSGQLRRRIAVAARLLTLFTSLTVATALVLPAAAVSAGAPQVGAVWVTDVNASSVTFHGEVNPNGVSTTYRFEYANDQTFQEKGFSGAAKAPAGGSASAGAGTSVLIVSQKVSALRAGTLYHYRLVASNLSGSAESSVRTFTTQAISGAFALPDNRRWEMVSPADKNGGAIQGPEQIHGGGVIQAAATGEAKITYSSASSFGGYEAQSAPPASQYISSRSASGWSTRNITAPAISGSYGNEPNGVPYQLFSSDLARALMLNGERCRGEGSDCPVMNPPLPGSGAPNGYQDYYLRNNEDGTYTAVLTATNAQLGLGPEEFQLAFAGASPDLRHLVLSTCAALTPEAVEQPNCESGGPNLYEWSGGHLRLVNLLEGNTHGSSDAHIAAQSGAISTDGTRIYFTQGEEATLFLREGEPGARLVSELSEFQTASSDGSIAYVTKAGSLYRYHAVGNTTELVANEVKGVLGASEDGKTVYYQDAAGLERWHEGTSSTLAPGAEAALPSDYPPTTGTARVSPDGNRLLFLSSEELTGYDNHDAATGSLDSQIFLWTASGGLSCISCNPTGERPAGPSTISGAYANGSIVAAEPGQSVTDSYKPRNLSTTQNRAFFESEDALVATDTNKGSDAYEWEAQGTGSCAKPGGCLTLLSSGTDGNGARFLDASESGADAYFLTTSSLDEARDPGSADVYDARIGGGFPVSPSPIPCKGDACVPLPEPPEDPTVGTLIPGLPNSPVHFPQKRCAKGQRRVTRKGHTLCITRRHKKRHRHKKKGGH